MREMSSETLRGSSGIFWASRRSVEVRSVLGQSQPGRADRRSGQVGFHPIATEFALQRNFVMCQERSLTLNPLSENYLRRKRVTQCPGRLAVSSDHANLSTLAPRGNTARQILLDQPWHLQALSLEATLAPQEEVSYEQ
jgi:hypothetical protein